MLLGGNLGRDTSDDILNGTKNLVSVGEKSIVRRFSKRSGKLDMDLARKLTRSFGNLRADYVRFV